MEQRQRLRKRWQRAGSLMLAGAMWVLVRAAGAADAAPQELVIPAVAVSAEGALAAKRDPRAAVWSRVPEQTVDMGLAPPVHEAVILAQAGLPAANRGIIMLAVSAIVDDQRIYYRLRWKDATHDDQRGAGIFPDAIAVEIPSGPESTSAIMGTRERPVTILRWDAASDAVESLIAGGPGTLTASHVPGVEGKGVYRSLQDREKNEWVVVISQTLDDAADGRTSLRVRRTYPAAFAVWQGSDLQRGGFKRVSGWVSIRLPQAR